ncbi:MAG: hypothetical protein FJ051_11085 [Cyanobacteria bacterium M_surface_9_m1_291]|nr:hypothetical protein [Cyanobacteria bacterium M_surface_9_m1_291]
MVIQSRLRGVASQPRWGHHIAFWPQNSCWQCSSSNETLFGKPGRFYVVMSYGIQHCLKCGAESTANLQR